MRKINIILILSLCCLFTYYNCLAADNTLKIIADIQVRGNRNVKKGTILHEVKAKKGDYYSDQALQDDIQNIYKLGSFEDVTLDIEDLPPQKDGEPSRVIVSFVISEKKLIYRIDFIGNKKVSRSKLVEEISLKKGEVFDAGQLALDSQTIEKIYKDKGYANAVVEPYSVTDEKTGKEIVTFYIKEGKRVLISVVTVAGTQAFSEKKIIKQMKTRRKKVFKQETFEEDLKKIEEFYKDRGYLKIHIDEPVVEIKDETEMHVSLVLQEGIRYKIGTIGLEGYTVYALPELLKLVKIREGEIYQQKKMNESVQGIQELYADKGYLRMKVTTHEEADEKAGVVNFVFELTEGEIVYVDRIFIEGNTYTKEKVIRREIIVQEGMPFSASKVRRSVQKLLNLGFLDDVQIDIQQPEAIDRADVVFEVKEGKPGMLTAGAGFSSVDGLLGTLQVSHINMWGLSHRLNAMWEFGERRQSYDISYTNPWFLDKPMSAGIDVLDVTRKRQYGTDYSAYRERRRGSNLSLGPRLTEELSLKFTYSFEQIKIYDIDTQYAETIKSTTQNSSSVTSSIIYDTRDSIYDPTRGHQESASVQVSGGPFGGNLHFYKPIVRGSYHITTFWKFVLSLSGRIGYVESFAPSIDSDIFYEKFYVGGGESVRGYDYRGEIGPIEGGRVMSVYNLEYGFPLVQENKRTILQFAIFADVGGAWRDPEEVSYKIGTPERYMKSGVGFGLRFKTPVFPIRLDWGYGLNHVPGEELSQFYFTIGNVF